MDTNRKLTTGIYTATDSFRSIEKHIAVMFDDNCGLVAVVGPADDEHTRESWEYAQLFADAVNLREALTQANELYNAVEAMNLELTERIEYANTGDLVTIPRELVLAMEAKMKMYENTLKFISEQALCTDDKRECVRAAIEALEAAK